MRAVSCDLGRASLHWPCFSFSGRVDHASIAVDRRADRDVATGSEAKRVDSSRAASKLQTLIVRFGKDISG